MTAASRTLTIDTKRNAESQFMNWGSSSSEWKPLAIRSPKMGGGDFDIFGKMDDAGLRDLRSPPPHLVHSPIQGAEKRFDDDIRRSPSGRKFPAASVRRSPFPSSKKKSLFGEAQRSKSLKDLTRSISSDSVPQNKGDKISLWLPEQSRAAVSGAAVRRSAEEPLEVTTEFPSPQKKSAISAPQRHHGNVSPDYYKPSKHRSGDRRPTSAAAHRVEQAAVPRLDLSRGASADSDDPMSGRREYRRNDQTDGLATTMMRGALSTLKRKKSKKNSRRALSANAAGNKESMMRAEDVRKDKRITAMDKDELHRIESGTFTMGPTAVKIDRTPRDYSKNPDERPIKPTAAALRMQAAVLANGSSRESVQMDYSQFGPNSRPDGTIGGPSSSSPPRKSKPAVSRATLKRRQASKRKAAADAAAAADAKVAEELAINSPRMQLHGARAVVAFGKASYKKDPGEKAPSEEGARFSGPREGKVVHDFCGSIAESIHQISWLRAQECRPGIREQ